MDDSKRSESVPGTACCQPDSNLADLTAGIDTFVPSLDHAWIVGRVQTAIGEVPVVSTSLQSSDRIGSWKARWGIGRMSYVVAPGLYAIGKPTEKSHVFVSANYKMSFDRVRSELKNIDAWIMVIDTKGINVWCAAGKGTFGTDEIVRRIAAVRLSEVVSHRRLILPQLGAPGVRAHEVKNKSGFHVIYGPVRASDIPAYLEAGFKATPEMRRIRFPLRGRIVLAPIELRQTEKYLLIVAACMLLLSGLGPGIYSLDRVVSFGLVSVVLCVLTAVAGAILPPLLLPYLPGKSFSVKGAWIGIAMSALLGWIYLGNPDLLRNWFSAAGWFCVMTAVTSFMAMNFTGSSTYTSLSGVLREMRIAVPSQIIVAVAGVGLWTAGLFV
ncbi:MAG: mercury methylation corrinoid protein HgcA [Candidatus Zixiibacteriota bacterium]